MYQIIIQPLPILHILIKDFIIIDLAMSNAKNLTTVHGLTLILFLFSKDVQERFEQINGKREDRRGVVFCGYFTQCLEIAKLQSNRMLIRF